MNNLLIYILVRIVKMKCEQTREHLVLHRQDARLTGTKRQEFLKHLRGCMKCQIEYEGLMHTATVLGNLEAPTPPPELIGNIQNKIREIHKQNQTAFFANPFSWIFNKVNLDLSPRLVNGVAVLCYMVVSAFLVKFAFFTDAPKQPLGLTAMEASRLVKPGQTSPSQLGSLKYNSVKEKQVLSTNVIGENKIGLSRPFIDIKSEEMWHTDTSNQNAETVDAPYPKTMSDKLTLFWNDIKTNL